MDEEPLNKVAADLNMSYSRAKSLGRKAMRKLRQYATRELEGSLG
jgi:DNA-directed RNA polymerase sigma subunit (sigma70/sigma32)